MKKNEAIQQFTEYLLVQHKSSGTIKSYVSVVSYFFNWITETKETQKTPSKRVEAYLTNRVVDDDISPSTQNVELNALVSFHRMLGVELKDINALRAKRRDRIPPILSRKQVEQLIEDFQPDYKLIPLLLYGVGLRINEALRLRVKDIDFDNNKIIVHEGKGDKDRHLHIPKQIAPLLCQQYDKAIVTWERDTSHKFNGVHCGGIEKKYPAYPKSKEWYWLFPAPEYSTDPKTHIGMMRHHVKDWFVQRLFTDVRERLSLPIYTTAQKLRHACFTHMAADMKGQGFPEKMIKTHLKEMAGHIADETIEMYLHLSAPAGAVIRSPLEIP